MFNNNFEYLEELEKQGLLDSGLFEDEAPDEPVKSKDLSYLQSRVNSLLWAYRDVGYLYANLNPLGEDYSRRFTNLPDVKTGVYHHLILKEFNLTKSDLDKKFYGGSGFGKKKVSLSKIIELLKETYCANIGVEFLHIQNKKIRSWLIERMESTRNKIALTEDQKKIILKDLLKTEEFEYFLHNTYIGQKRFSIEGCEVLIPALHFLVDYAIDIGISRIILGATHRGRLSILNQILNLSVPEIISIFEDTHIPVGSGDVKYHIGFDTEHIHESGKRLTISLAPNPSHLESVGPVVSGKTRGLQNRYDDTDQSRIIPIVLHGDAAFSGQGVVSEIFNLSGLKGYSTGGTVHIVINNMIGFTTPGRSSHSSLNSTDIAKMMPVPIFHVNGDDPESVVHVIRMALEYRQTFRKDVVVDIFCYRKYGHNEGDDPSFTQPRMYSLIKNHPSAAFLYGDKCADLNICSKKEQEDIRKEIRKYHKDSFELWKKKAESNKLKKEIPKQIVEEKRYKEFLRTEAYLINLGEKLSFIPDNFRVHNKLKRIIKENFNLFKEDKKVHWAFAESLAFGSLIMDGIHIRLSGQDSERGTFSQRHLVWWEVNKTQPGYYIPLNHLNERGASISVYNSPLSEYSILGFEYGYSLANPEALVIWEAQFGDFCNGAQVIIDNYLVSAETKWGIRCGLVMLLPHGYEGQGPEHSSAHIERFLQLCAEDNIQVCNPTTPAQYYHLLRRQVVCRRRRPLIIFSAKSLLRLPEAVSSIKELTDGEFQEVLYNDNLNDKKKIIFCCGKIYFDLVKYKTKNNRDDTVIIRIEQLFPFPKSSIQEILERTGAHKELFWVQEESRNRGAWSFIKFQFELYFKEIKIEYRGRDISAATATGSYKKHLLQQEKILKEVFENSGE